MQKLDLKGLNESIYVYDTKCGLKIYMWVNEHVNSMYASLSVKYGSIHTKFKVGKKVYNVSNGLAHFLEHIKFNVDEDKTAHDVFYNIGGDSNAFTTFDYTSYLVFATSNKEKNLEELIRFVYTPYFTNKNIEKEKGIIIEEAKMGLDDSDSIIFFRSLENTLQKSKYRNTITGTPDEIEKISLNDITKVYDIFYHPKNMFLTITGNFNPYEMARVTENVLSEFKFKEYKKPIIIKEKEPRSVKESRWEEKINIVYPKIRFNLKMDMKRFFEYSNLELRLISNLILNSNFGLTSDFKDELLEKDLINSLNYQCDIYDDTYLIGIEVTTKYVDEIITLVKDKINNLKVSPLEFKRKKNALLATMVLDYEYIESVSMRIQDDILNNGGIVTNLKEIIENIKFSDIEKIISLYDTTNMNINIFWPNE